MNETLSIFSEKQASKEVSTFDKSLFEKGKEDFVQFWENEAKKLYWSQQWNEVLEWEPPFAKWFLDGKTNACYNCLDRYVQKHPQKTAILWESESGEEKTYTYAELHTAVCRFANILKAFDVKKGDRVAIYMPMIPEAIMAMLACARIGAVHVVIFGGIGAAGVRDRLNDAEASFLITADGGMRRGQVIPYKKTVDEALLQVPTIKQVIVVRHAENECQLLEQRDYFYHDEVKKVSSSCPIEWLDSEDLLFILYTSGSTGKAKGIIHTVGGYLVGVHSTTEWVFNPKHKDIFWCTADVGWITGHSFLVYGPLSHGLTIVSYEGTPDYPQKNRFWKIIEKYGVTIFYTAPTTIRMFIKYGTEYIKNCDLSSLRLLGTIGEPINPDVWKWYFEHIGNKKCPIVDTWFQTETGGLVISPMPGVTNSRPGSVTSALPGIKVEILDETGCPAQSGYLAITHPYPSMLRGIYKDPNRFKETYWCKWDGKYYFTGDGAYYDKDGYIWITGRLDDVLKVSGHRIGTAEVESSLVEHPWVAEAAVVGIPHDLKGESIMAFVILKETEQNIITASLEKLLQQDVAHRLGSYAKPDRIFFVKDLPKTRSGKIMRRILRNTLEGKPFGDIATLENHLSLNELKNLMVNV